jgi:hypothetical protein
MDRRNKGLLLGMWMAFFAFNFSLFTSCGNKRLSPEELQHKLDSVKVIEIKEKLKAQGIDLESSSNPLKMFYDSLNIQPLPISYSEDYVKFLPAFLPVPEEIAAYLNFEGRKDRKAITLPETLGARLLLLAADDEEERYSLWLYSLDDDYLPVDKLCLYAVEDEVEEDEYGMEQEEFIQWFSITSDYEIRLIDYTKKDIETRSNDVYCLDPSRRFILQEKKD